MKKNSKKPEIRRKELLDIALQLFSEKGYEAVSVRDILDGVNGAPGMFYYYFKSKQDIYLAAIEQYLTKRIDIRYQILDDDVLSFEEKQAVFRKLVEEDLIGYRQHFQQPESLTITDDAYKLWDFMQMLNRMIGPYSRFILQGVREGKLSGLKGISEENAEAFATYALYSAWGMYYNGQFAQAGCQFDTEDIYYHLPTSGLMKRTIRAGRHSDCSCRRAFQATNRWRSARPAGSLPRAAGR